MASFWAITAVFLLIQALLTVGIQVTGKHPGDTKYGQPCSMPSSCTSSWYCCTAADKPGRCRLKHTLAITTMLCLWLMCVSSVCVRPMLLQELTLTQACVCSWAIVFIAQMHPLTRPVLIA